MIRLLVLLMLVVAPGAPSRANDASPAFAGSLAGSPAWQAYKQRFVTAQGRVVDTANGDISHSEGQGYGMLLAVAARDRDAFDRIWGWTRANLMVRGDHLAAWRFEPDQRPAIADMNNASDGDILLAWALVEASETWRDPVYRIAARRIAVEIGRKLILRPTPHGALLLPGVTGFAAEDRRDGPVVNLSYWVFPAFDRLALVAPEHDWAGLSRSGLALIDRSGPFPPDWTSLSDAVARPAQGFPPTFGHNALRIPLYLALAGHGEPARHARFARRPAPGGAHAMPIVDVAAGRTVGSLAEPGYAAIAALSACVATGSPIPEALRTPTVAGQHYYPATLHLFVVIALRTRYPTCLSS